MIENIWLSYYYHLFACARECYVQLAVDSRAVGISEGRGGEEVELIAMADAEGVDDDIALATLEALYRVDGDV